MSGRRLLRLEALVAGVCLIASEAVAADLEPFDRAQGGQHAPQRPALWLTGILVAELPKFVPQTNEGVETTISTEPAVLKDGVLNLPAMTIRPRMKESPSDYGLLTPKGRLGLAMKTHPGMRIGNLFGLNQGIAMFMQMEQQEVRAKSVLYHQVNRILLDDSANSRETRLMLESALGRANAAWLKNSSER